MRLIERSPKSITSNVDPIRKRIIELYALIYQHYSNLGRLYSFAAGIKHWPKNNGLPYHQQRALEDERRLLWTSKNLKTQIEKLETELQFLLKGLLPKQYQR